MEEYGSVTPNPKVVSLNSPCVCKSGIVCVYGNKRGVNDTTFEKKVNRYKLKVTVMCN